MSFVTYRLSRGSYFGSTAQLIPVSLQVLSQLVNVRRIRRTRRLSSDSGS